MIRYSSQITPDTKVKDLQGFKIVSPAKQERDKAFYENERKKHKEKGFVMVDRDNIIYANKELSLSQAGLMMFLVSFMKFNEEGKLFHKGERLTVTNIAKLVGKSPKQTRRTIDELEALGFVAREKVGRKVYLNVTPALMVCGYTDSERKRVKVYKERLRGLSKKLSLNELGLLIFMLGHLHWKSHVLCANPDENETSNVVLWKRRDVIEALGVSKDFIYKTLNKFLQLKITVEVKSVNEGIVLHPSLVSRQETRPTFDEILHVINESLTKENYKKH
ncbi:helix-turn-helix domain-containing protein [Bacillus gobiensis]|uniref:hypothetical protein n=1 Tax=Bacillus gobiensis TaxID=1441095 RepID=UPI003D2065B8